MFTVSISILKNKMGKRKSYEAQMEEYQLYQNITSIPVPVDTPVYDNCDILRAKIEWLSQCSNVAISRWSKFLGLKTSSLTSFRRLNGKGAGAGNRVYQPVYRFFEQLRLFRGEGKTQERMQAEQNFPNGYPLRHDNGRRWVRSNGNVDPGMYDIDEMARRRRVQGIPDLHQLIYEVRRRRRRVQVPNRRRVQAEQVRQQQEFIPPYYAQQQQQYQYPYPPVYYQHYPPPPPFVYYNNYPPTYYYRPQELPQQNQSQQESSSDRNVRRRI